MNEVVRELALDLAEGRYELDFLKHVPGIENVLPDQLSRILQPGAIDTIPTELMTVKRAVAQRRDSSWWETADDPKQSDAGRNRKSTYHHWGGVVACCLLPACLPPAALPPPLRNLISGVPWCLGLEGVTCPSGRPSGSAGVTPVTDPSRGRAGCRRDGRASGTGVRQGREHRCPGTRSAGSRRCSTPGSPRGRHPRAGPVGRVRGPHRLPEQGLGGHRAGPERGGGAPT